MRKLAVAFPLLLAGCPMAAITPAPQRYAGFFQEGFEVESFQPCGLKETWWVTEGTALRQRYRDVARSPYERAYVVLRGETGPEGRYGHLGAYSRELAVTDVVELRPARPGDCE